MWRLQGIMWSSVRKLHNTGNITIIIIIWFSYQQGNYKKLMSFVGNFLEKHWDSNILHWMTCTDKTLHDELYKDVNYACGFFIVQDLFPMFLMFYYNSKLSTEYHTNLMVTQVTFHSGLPLDSSCWKLMYVVSKFMLQSCKIPHCCMWGWSPCP